MKRIFNLILSLVIVLSFATGAFAQSYGSGDVFLWKAQSSNSTVYLMGSIHLAKADIYPLDSKIENAFKASDILAVEVNLNDIDPLVVQQMFMAKGIYGSGETLKDHVSPKTYDLVADKLRSLGMDIAFMANYKPWFLAINLVTLELLKLGFNPEYGVDKYFLNKAKGEKEIVELESIEYQINLFDSFTDKQEELFLFSTLLEINVLEEEMDNLVRAWRNGSAKELERLLHKGLRQHPEIRPIYEKVFYQRNRQMVDKIQTYLNSGKTYFVVVGAGHLVGKEGIIDLLKEKGYQINQL